MNNTLLSILTAATLLVTNPQPPVVPKALSQVSYLLSNRYANKAINEVFSDNILLTIAYLGGSVKKKEDISWSRIQEDKETQFSLKPGETFAFHDAVLEKYKGKIAATTNAHFSWDDGFRSDGWLVGDGVCHLASFLYVAANNAGLSVEAPTSHDFAVIPNIEKKDGVSIFSESTLQNLYITNNKNVTLAFIFIQKDSQLTIRIEEAKK